MRMANFIKQADVNTDGFIQTHLVYCHGGTRLNRWGYSL